MWLVVCSGVHLALAAALVRSHGAVGLIAADSVNMALRIAYCLRFISRHFSAVPGHALRDLFPSSNTLLAMGAASMVVLASNALWLGGLGLPGGVVIPRGWLPGLGGGALQAVGFGPAAVSHVALGGSALLLTLFVVYQAEGKLVKEIVALKRAAA